MGLSDKQTILYIPLLSDVNSFLYILQEKDLMKVFVCLLGCVSSIRKIKDGIKFFPREPAIVL